MKSQGRAIIYLDPAELNHLQALVLGNEQNGEYYGPREQYWKRHERIKEKLEWAYQRGLVGPSGPKEDD